MCVDPVNRALYYGSHDDSGPIYRYDIDADTHAEWLSGHRFAGCYVDAKAKYVYWTTFTDGELYRAELAGGGASGPGTVKLLASVPDAELRAVVHDEVADQFYVTETKNNAVWRLDATTGEATRMLDGDAARLGAPYGLALDTSDDALYISDTGANCVWRCEITGRGLEKLEVFVEHFTSPPTGLAVVTKYG